MDNLPKELFQKIMWSLKPTDSLRVRAVNVPLKKFVKEFNLYWFYWLFRIRKPEYKRYHKKEWTMSCIRGIKLHILHKHLYDKGIVLDAFDYNDSQVYANIKHLQDAFPCCKPKHYFYYLRPKIERNDVDVRDMNPDTCYLAEYLFMMYRTKRGNLKKLEFVDRSELLISTKAQIGDLKIQIKALQKREELLENYTYYSRTPSIFANKSLKKYKL